MTLRDAIVAQFKHPHGVLGRLAGWIMATRPSNLRRNRWTVDLLDVGPTDRVLEIGCGPGVALAACAARAGFAVGLDHSSAMLAQARRRNRAAVAAGRVWLELGGVDRLPELGGPFDQALAVNVAQFLSDRPATFRALAAMLVPGGLVALTYQPRHKSPTRGDAVRMAEALADDLAAAGFVEVRTEELPLRPVPAVCVLARTPARV